MYMLYKQTNARLFCDAHPGLHVIRNVFEKVTLDVSISSSPPSSKSPDIVVLPCKLVEL